MATFGTLPGVKVTTTGGAVSGVTVGRSQYLVLIGHGDNSAGSASTNTPVKINSRSDADAKFGTGSDLAGAYRDALANGANKNFIYGVMALNTQSTENFGTSTTPVSSGVLTNVPVVDELEDVSVTDVTNAVSVDVQFVYDASVPTPSTANTINLNPVSGEWTADESSEYDITYKYSDWSGAITGAESAIDEDEFGLFVPLSNAESVASTLATSVGNMRSIYKMAIGLMAAEPNATTTDYKPKYDTGTYSDNVDDDAVFLVSPVTEDGSDTSILGAIAGVFAGNDVTNPVYNDEVVETDNLEQKLSSAEADDLRNAQVIPVRDRGAIRVLDNLSTSTATDWERDYWRRRIVDLVIATVKEIGDSTLGAINDPDTRTNTEVLISEELGVFVDAGLLQPNTSGATRQYVDVYKYDADTVGIDIGVTPYGIVKQIETSLTINT